MMLQLALLVFEESLVSLHKEASITMTMCHYQSMHGGYRKIKKFDSP